MFQFGAHWKYLKYVLKHKAYVFLACLELGVPLWIAILHDWSKFRPDEWIPYARYFNGKFPSVQSNEFRVARLNNVWLYTREEVEQDFNRAWLNHIHRNKHHPQHWVLREDSGETICLPIPHVYMLELVADWKGAALAQGNNLLEWYPKNKDKIPLHPRTRAEVEELLGIAPETPDGETVWEKRDLLSMIDSKRFADAWQAASSIEEAMQALGWPGSRRSFIETASRLRRLGVPLKRYNPKYPSVPPGTLPKRAASERQFALVWQTSRTILEVAERLGMSYEGAIKRARGLRAKGIYLKRMLPRRRSYKNED